MPWLDDPKPPPPHECNFPEVFQCKRYDIGAKWQCPDALCEKVWHFGGLGEDANFRTCTTWLTEEEWEKYQQKKEARARKKAAAPWWLKPFV